MGGGGGPGRTHPAHCICPCTGGRLHASVSFVTFNLQILPTKEIPTTTIARVRTNSVIPTATKVFVCGLQDVVGQLSNEVVKLKDRIRGDDDNSDAEDDSVPVSLLNRVEDGYGWLQGSVRVGQGMHSASRHGSLGCMPRSKSWRQQKKMRPKWSSNLSLLKKNSLCAEKTTKKCGVIM